jgi:dsRNA-specific ribonuclease
MSSLKRSRSRQYGRSSVPPLPQLTGDIILEVFTHKSIQFDGPNSEFGDNTRLAELGGQALQMVVTRTLFDLKEPMLNVSEIAVSSISIFFMFRFAS